MAIGNATVMTNACQKLDKEHIGYLNHLLNLIVVRFFNSKIFSQQQQYDIEDEETMQFEDIFDEEDEDEIDIQPSYSPSEFFTAKLDKMH